MEFGKIEDRGGEVIPTKYYDGINYPPLVSGNVKDHLEAIKNMTYKKGDVLLDSFPKTVLYNTWFEHVKAWLDFQKNHPDLPILMISFEDMKKDLRSCVEKMAEFLGTKQDPDFLDEVTNKCQFSAMLNAKTKNTQETAMSKDGGNPFYRKGDVGDWKNWLTVAQDEMFDALIEKNMKDIDLEVKYTL